MSFAQISPLSVGKAEKKGSSKGEVDQIILWLTGFSHGEPKAQIWKEVDMETFFAERPRRSPDRSKITGTVRGSKVEQVEDPADA